MNKFDGYRQNIWDVSSLDAFQRCPEFYRLRVLEGYQRRYEADTSDLDWGHAWHLFLETFERLRFAGHTDTYRMVAEALDRAISAYPDLANSTDNRRTRQTLIRAAFFYIEQFGGLDDPLTTIALPDGSPALECRFEFEIPQIARRFSLRADRLASAEGLNWVVDNKSTKKSLSDFIYSFRPNNQVAAYLLGLRRYLGLPIHGFMVNACEMQVGDNRFARFEIHLTDAELDEFEQNLIHNIRAADEAALTNFYPRNYAMCWCCPMRSVCSWSPEYRPDILRTDFDRIERK